MCAILETTNDPQFKVSDGNVVAYKYYKVSNNCEGDPILTSFYMSNYHGISNVDTTVYEPGNTYEDSIKLTISEIFMEAKDGYSKKTTVWRSKRGYHLAVSLSDCVKQIEEKAFSGYWDNIVVCKCVIPKGVKYIEMSEQYSSKKGDYSNLDTIVTESYYLEKELFHLSKSDIQKKKRQGIDWMDHTLNNVKYSPKVKVRSGGI